MSHRSQAQNAIASYRVIQYRVSSYRRITHVLERQLPKQFPKLGCVARIVFACLAASSASERAFSKAGAIYSKRRGGNMKLSTLEALCFLHSAAKELQVAKTGRKLD